MVTVIVVDRSSYCIIFNHDVTSSFHIQRVAIATIFTLLLLILIVSIRHLLLLVAYFKLIQCHYQLLLHLFYRGLSLLLRLRLVWLHHKVGINVIASPSRFGCHFIVYISRIRRSDNLRLILLDPAVTHLEGLVKRR